MYEQAFSDLSTILDGRFSRSKAQIDAHARSEAHFADCPPDAVAYPHSGAELAQIVATCAHHGCPVTGWGAGTSLEGHALAVHGGLVVDFSQMDRIIELREQDMIARVQPGVTREALNEALRSTGLFFPVDPGADASIGGMAATRASGTTAVRYGTMRDNVMGLEVVLASGEIVRTGSLARKSSAGYDLTALFVGSEGTLGLFSEIVLKLYPQPEAITAAVCAFPAMKPAVAAVVDTIASGIPMARIEFVDAASIAAINDYSKADFPTTPHLFVEFHGSEAGASADAELFSRIAQHHGASGLEVAATTEDRNRLWKLRHTTYWAVLASRPGASALVTDVCVPMSELADAVDQTVEDIAASSLSGPIVGHVGDGNFHSALLVDPESPRELEIAKALAERMVERALACGGTSTGEHGVGMGKIAFMEQEHGAGWAVMGQIKRALDPNNILNPGKIVARN